MASPRQVPRHLDTIHRGRLQGTTTADRAPLRLAMPRVASRVEPALVLATAAGMHQEVALSRAAFRVGSTPALATAAGLPQAVATAQAVPVPSEQVWVWDTTLAASRMLDPAAEAASA